MNQIATIKPKHPSVLLTMAERYGMLPEAFEETVRATCSPVGKGGQAIALSKPQFAAFLLVAKEYNLNPLTKEIYAFPTRSGGIQPVVSIDGWMNLINSHPAMDGLEFDDHLDEDGDLTAVSARIWRKDRAKPIVVTEYMEECRRKDIDTWKQWPRRMLRHKAAIQCSRYAFGFSGIVDPDEAERGVSEMRDVTPPPAPSAPSPAETIHVPASKQGQGRNDPTHDPETGEITDDDGSGIPFHMRDEHRHAPEDATEPQSAPQTGTKPKERKGAADKAEAAPEPADAEGGAAPTTKAGYIQWCHEQIEAAPTKDALSAWWKGEAGSRKHFKLSQEECDGLKERVAERGAELAQDLLSAG